MKMITITQNEWQQEIETLKNAYRLFGPVKQKDYFEFKALGPGEQPDLRFQNTRLSPKSIIQPQWESLWRRVILVVCHSLNPILHPHRPSPCASARHRRATGAADRRCQS